MQTLFLSRASAMGLYCAISTGKLMFGGLMTVASQSFSIPLHAASLHDATTAVKLAFAGLITSISRIGESPQANRIVRIGFGIMLVATLAGSLMGCATYEESDYGG
ncbi:MAG TPA: hypothetical protein VL981_01810, partial [Candidatus Methylacidiphilales bacterium]|nr:hypothetical protein [Candidatus Methylacidiphilales bacterium]